MPYLGKTGFSNTFFIEIKNKLILIPHRILFQLVSMCVVTMKQSGPDVHNYQHRFITLRNLKLNSKWHQLTNAGISQIGHTCNRVFPQIKRSWQFGSMSTLKVFEKITVTKNLPPTGVELTIPGWWVSCSTYWDILPHICWKTFQLILVNRHFTFWIWIGTA